MPCLAPPSSGTLLRAPLRTLTQLWGRLGLCTVSPACWGWVPHRGPPRPVPLSRPEPVQPQEADCFSSGKTRNSRISQCEHRLSSSRSPPPLLSLGDSGAVQSDRVMAFVSMSQNPLWGLSVQLLCHISPQMRACNSSLSLPSPGHPRLRLREPRAPHQRAGGRHLWPPVPQEAAGGRGGEAEPVCCRPGGQDLSLQPLPPSRAALGVQGGSTQRSSGLWGPGWGGPWPWARLPWKEALASGGAAERGRLRRRRALERREAW